MIDGIKISFRSEVIEERLKCLGVEVFSRVSNSTGEEVKKTAKYKHLTIIIHPSKTVIIKGSLHKYWKDENYSDFSRSELIKCIHGLSEKLGFNPAEAQIQNFEFGLNINTLFNPYIFCEYVIAHKGHPFSQFHTNSMQVGYHCDRSQYAIKVYDKGKQQYLKNENKLRFEIKTNKMALVKSIGITKLSDLTMPNCLSHLGIILNSAFLDLIISDEVDEIKLSKTEKRIYSQCINPKIWIKFNRNERCKKKKLFNNIIEKHGINQWKKTVARMLDEKCRMLSVQ